VNRARAPHVTAGSDSAVIAGDQCLPDLLLARAREQPGSTAIVCQDTVLSYRELARRATALAVYLRQAGVTVDSRVGLFVEPSIELVVGAWGILLAGGAYLPLSPEYPEERLRYLIGDSGTRVILAQEGLRGRLSRLVRTETRIVAFDGTWQSAAAQPPAAGCELATGLRPDHLAYVIYTSGSTGTPKGVMIEHRSIVNQLNWLNTVHKLDRDRIVLQKTPMSFDAAQWEILAPGCGSKVVMGGPGVYRDPRRLIDTIVTHGVTTLQCVPTLLQALLDTEELHECKSLTQIFSGGEALSRALVLQCLEALPDCDVINLYGPTECAINSSAFIVDRARVADGPPTIPIGTPVHNMQYHVLDGTGAPAAVGEIGELYISGVQLARGYLNRPELTAEVFLDNPFRAGDGQDRLYRTGDLVHWNADGTVQFVGRVDNQIKLRGFRIELDEIRRAIEAHDWVRNAAVVVCENPRTRSRNLVAFVELNPKEAALMDQGNHGAHHQSKDSRLQIRAQLSNGGCRSTGEIAGKVMIDLPGRAPTERQRQRVFARKTYRFFEGGEVVKADLLRLLGRQPGTGGYRGAGTRQAAVHTLGLAEFGELLRYFGQYLSDERLLPKYGYASPGALYATQLYVELSQVAGLPPGIYYYHPVDHRLVLMRAANGQAAARFAIHFVGKRWAIEPVYKDNVREVLEIEAGHMVGLFDEVLPDYGLSIGPAEYTPAIMESLACAAEDYYLGTFEVTPYSGAPLQDSLEVYLQSHPGKIADLPAGQYRYAGGTLHRISDEIVLQRHVIAINQQVYARSSFGISLVGPQREDWLGYLDLGRRLHHLQANELNLGLMSSGYSSRTGRGLPSARRLEGILNACGAATGPSYFFVGGRVSDEQVRNVGMKEDLVHMKGPTELIRDDLINFLPDYMMPNEVVVLDRLPLTANGKIDCRSLAARDVTSAAPAARPPVAPRTRTEARIGEIWRKSMKQDTVSVHDDFFESGGNSLIAVGLVHRINRELRTSLPLQVLFETPTIERLALKIDGGDGPACSRLVPLQPGGARNPIFCWPGLGGYVMNLRLLAAGIGGDQPFLGVQAHGINKGEAPYASIEQMAAADVEAIRRRQPVGPYTLWGYSFGARVAFETAYQLERSGERVQTLFLIAPGSPEVRIDGEPARDDQAFLTILFSVFWGCTTGPLLAECLAQAGDEDAFASFISSKFDDLDADLARRITRIVRRTYHFDYGVRELTQRWVQAPITIFRARGDNPSSFERASGYCARKAAVTDLETDHYGVLREPGVDELVAAIHRRLSDSPR